MYDKLNRQIMRLSNFSDKLPCMIIICLTLIIKQLILYGKQKENLDTDKMNGAEKVDLESKKIKKMFAT